MVQTITKQDFLDKVFNFEKSQEWDFAGEVPAIIDFYADWCGPCKALAPLLEELQKEYNGKINIYKVDTEAEQELAGAFGIRSIPSLLFCPKGEKPQMAQGALPKQQFEELIKDILKVEK
ncbi:thioredoxin [Wenyingzhuangia gilva]